MAPPAVPATAETVSLFNKLPTPESTIHGKNDWVFGVRHVDLCPAADIVVVINRETGALLDPCSSGQILGLGVSEQARVVTRLLLDVFIQASKASDITSPDAFAPRRLAAENQEMATAVEHEASAYQRGLNPASFGMGVCAANETQYINRAFDSMVTAMRCMQLLPRAPPFVEEPEVASQGWRGVLHGPAHPVRPLAHHLDESAQLDAYTYYNTVARATPLAQDLLNRLYLGPPDSPPPLGVVRHVSCFPALFSLVSMGLDNPENMTMLFGPNWETGDMREKHLRARLLVLLQPPQGSISGPYIRMTQQQVPDRSPAPIVIEELDEIARVRLIQVMIRGLWNSGSLIRSHIGLLVAGPVRVVSGPGRSTTYMTLALILASFGPNWGRYLEACYLAHLTIDLDDGVPGV